MNSVCIWKKQFSKHTKVKGYLTGCHTWINKNYFALDEIRYCPLCGGEMDLYMSPEEIKEKQKNTPNFLYIKEEYFEKNLKNIKNCKGERCGKDNDSYYYILRYTTQNEYYNFKNFLKDNGYSINTCLVRSGRWGFKESPAIIKKIKGEKQMEILIPKIEKWKGLQFSGDYDNFKKFQKLIDTCGYDLHSYKRDDILTKITFVWSPYLGSTCGKSVELSLGEIFIYNEEEQDRFKVIKNATDIGKNWIITENEE